MSGLDSDAERIEGSNPSTPTNKMLLDIVFKMSKLIDVGLNNERLLWVSGNISIMWNCYCSVYVMVYSSSDTFW